MAKPEEKEWTLMFHFASDNPLAPAIVSQLKAIKQAGFHHDVNVIAQFDPQPEGTPTHIFDVNHVMKLSNPRPKIGFIGFNERDPFVTNLIEDKLWREQVDRDGAPIRQRLRGFLATRAIDFNPPEPPPDRTRDVPTGAAGNVVNPASNRANGRTRELNPRESLQAFLTFCREAYPARHYALFILGHGVVVGNDVFLFDENPGGQSLSLRELGSLLSDFKRNLNEGAEFELVSFHSCSVSSLEVAYELQGYELKGTANYMLASQGSAFVGSWPYRQILISMFNNVDDLKKLEREGKSKEAKENIKELLGDIFSYCYYNSTDFLLAGYSFDLCLCNLNKVTGITAPLAQLSKALSSGLTDEDELFKDLIVLAHWESQSQWQESYTDLHDFCFCLSRQCRRFLDRLGADAESLLGQRYTKLQEIISTCDDVMAQLEKEIPKGEEKIIVKSEFAGPGHQYSHGLSVYFPWSRPVSDMPILEEYGQYKLNETMKSIFDGTSWLTFLEDYFAQSMRRPQKAEANDAQRRTPALPDEQIANDELAEDLLSLVFNGEGRLSIENSPTDVLKIGTRDPLGDDCSCSSVKNYPRDTRARREKAQKAAEKEEAVPVSQPSSRRFSILP